MDHDRVKGGWKTAVFFVFAVLIVCAVSNIAGRVKGRRIGREMGLNEGYARGYAEGYAAPHPGDTTYILDTTHHEAPEPVAAKPSGTEKVLLGTIAELTARIDSLRAMKPDTAIVEVPVTMETKTYKGEDYEAQVSGWHPSLDWVNVYPKTIVVTQWADPPAQKSKIRVGFGFTAGPAVIWTPDDGVKAGAGIAAGFSVTF